MCPHSYCPHSYCTALQPPLTALLNATSNFCAVQTANADFKGVSPTYSHLNVQVTTFAAEMNTVQTDVMHFFHMVLRPLHHTPSLCLCLRYDDLLHPSQSDKEQSNLPRFRDDCVASSAF
jgi:hypothetical protein